MTPHPPKHDPEPRRPRPRHRWAFEQLEDRTLLATVPGADLAEAIPLTAPSGTHAGTIAPGAPVFFRIDPTADALLIARVHAEGTLTRLSLLDSQGHLLVQSDGQSATNLDDLIAQHVVAGTDYLELQSLGGAGGYTLTADLTDSSQPNQPLLVGPLYFSLEPGFLVTGEFTGDGRADLAVAGFDPAGQGAVEVLLGAGDGTFQAAPPISIGSLFDPSALVTGDYNGDGRADLAVAGTDFSGQGAVEVLLGAGDGTFRAAAPISTGSLFPFVLVTGDYNGDGRADLAVAGTDFSGQGAVEVLLGAGDGTFRAAAPISTGSLFPFVLVTGDHNGDGRADLAVAGTDSFGQGAVEVLLGAGDGTFRAAPPISTGSLDPFVLVTGDHNGDGRADLAVAGTDSSGQGAVEVLLGAGDGTFRAAAPISTGSLDPSALVTGDYNGDGRADLAVAGFDNSADQVAVEVLLGAGDGTFQAAPPISTGSLDPSALITGDYNDDGRADLAVAADQDGAVEVLLGAGDGTFQAAAPISISTGSLDPSALVAGDYNGDGRADLAVAEFDPAGQGAVEVLLGAGDGTFRVAPQISTGSLFDPSALVTGDYNGDGRADLAVAGTDSSGQGAVEVLLGAGDGTFRAAPPISTGSLFDPSALVTGDYNGDGCADLAVAGTDFSGQGAVEVLLGAGDGTFRAAPPISTGNLFPSALVTGDHNGDGRADLAVAGTDSSGQGAVEVLLGAGDGTFRAAAPISTGSLDPSALVTGEFTGDGRADLAVAAGQGAVEVLLGAGDGTFQAAPPISTGSLFDLSALVTGDYNGDGRADLAVAGFVPIHGQYAVEVLLGAGDGTFQAAPPIRTRRLSQSVLVTGDHNGDGRADLAVAGFDRSYGQGEVEVLLGVGDGTFRAALPISTGSLDPSALVTGDYNGDGRADLAVAGFDNSAGQVAVEVLLGAGDGTFQAAPPISARFSVTSALVTGDYNGDGRADLAVAGYDPSSNQVAVEVQLGVGDGTFRAAPLISIGHLSRSALVTGDYNGDGRADLAVAGTDSSDQVAVEVQLGVGDGTFQAAPPISIGSLSSFFLVTGDYNGDGLGDLAVAGFDFSSRQGAVEVLLGAGDGTFKAAAPISKGSLDPSILATGDYNGDGRADLAVAGFDPAGQGAVEVLLGVGDGTFRAAAPISTGSLSPSALLAGDYNGDGRADLAVAGFAIYSPQSGEVEVLLGAGDGTFRAAALIFIGRSYSTSLVRRDFNGDTGDYNGDGRADLAYADYAGLSLQVVLSLGNGEFAKPSEFTGAIHDIPLVADPGDGSLDVFAVNQDGNILWRKEQPQAPGSFVPPITINVNPFVPSRDITFVPTRQGPLLASVDLRDDAISLYAYRGGQFLPVASLVPSVYRQEQFFRVGSLATGAIPAQVVAGDLNGDGNVDLVVRNAGAGTASVYLGDGDGGFVRQADVPLGLGASDIALADLGGTGRLDLVVTNQVTGDVRVLPGNGDGTFGAPSVYPAGAGPYGLKVSAAGTTVLASQEATAGVALGTFTRGGTTGLATIDPGSNSLAVLAGLGGGALANPRPFLTNTRATVVRTGDFDRDGVSDLAVLDSDGLTIYLGDGQGGFDKARTKTYDVGPDPTGLTVADVNGDGIPDLLVGNGYGDVLVLLGDGKGGFAPRNIDQQIALAVANLGANGPDVFAFADKGQDRITVQAGSASASQILGDRTQGVLDPGAVMLKDLNGDGLPDLVVANGGGNDVLVYLGLGNGQYDQVPTPFPVGTDPVGITVADVNGDGLPDLVVANQGSNDVSTLLGKGQGQDWTLTPGPRLKAGSGPTATVVRDVNGDSVPDVLVSDSQSNDVRVLRGVGLGFFNDTNPTTFTTGSNPGPLIVGDFTGPPGQLDLVTINAGSNNLTLIRDINGGNVVPESLPSGGAFPVAAVEIDVRGGEVSDLLVANSDGHLALFLGGIDGLELSSIFENPDLPNPTALAMDDLGRIFGVSEGVPAAVQIILGLGGDGVGNVFPGPSGPGELLVAPLLPLSPASLAVVATLLSTSVEITSEEITGPAEAENVENSLATAEPTGGATDGPGATGSTALPNQSPLQSFLPKSSSDTDPEGEADPIWDDISGTAVVTQVSQNPVARFLSGLDEAFSRARLKARQGSLFAPLAHAGATGPKLRALDALLARLSPVVTAMGGPVPAMALEAGRAGVAVARAVDAALQALGSDREWPGAANGDDQIACGGPVPVGRSALTLGMASIGLAAVAWPVADLVRPPASRRQRRIARPGRDERGAARFEVRE